MIPQVVIIERLGALCQQDERVVAALLHGSFSRNEGDAYSDIDFSLFFADEQLPSVDKRAWVEQVAPVAHFYTDPYGHHIAIFENFVRLELYIKAASAMSEVSSWQGDVMLPSLESALILDRTGELTKYLQPLLAPSAERNTPEMVQSLSDVFLNNMLAGSNMLVRGEFARSLGMLGLSQRYLLWLARLCEHSTHHWWMPNCRLEQELSPQAYERYQQCMARLEPFELKQAYLSTWAWGMEMMEQLAQQHQFVLPSVFTRFGQRLQHLLGGATH
ncbi:MAG: nucleotidyltransferase domain-containing protein [Caldilineaceae bacterium]